MRNICNSCKKIKKNATLYKNLTTKASMNHTVTKNVLFFSFLFITPFLIQAENELSTPTHQTINNNNTASPVIHNNNGPVIYVIKISHKYITNYCSKWLEEHLPTTDIQELKKLIQKIAWENRYTIGGGALVCCHFAVSAFLLSDYCFITQNKLWANWKPECSFAQLCAISQQDLGKELILTIGQRNFNQKNPTDATHPLISFINDIDNEIKCIERYIKTATSVKKLGLIRIFPTNDTKIVYAEKQCERAHFIKHIFLSWLAEHNFTNSRKKCTQNIYTFLQNKYLKGKQCATHT
jgi:hypothetical protein